MHWIVPANSRIVCLSVISPFSTATCVPPHAACLTRPTPLRASSRGELIWNQTWQVSCSAWSFFYSFYPYITLHKCFFYDWITLVFVCQLCSLPVWPQWQRPAAGTPSSPNQKPAHLWTRPNYSLHMWPPAELWTHPDLLRRVLDKRPWCDDPDLKIHTRDINLEGRVTWSV